MLKKIAIAFLVLIALVVLNWWNVQQSEKKEALKEQQDLLLDIKKQNITKIAVYNSQGQWQLRKRFQEQDGSYSDDLAVFANEFDEQPQWLLEWNKGSYLASQQQVDALLEDLTQAKKDKYIAHGSEKFSNYGIAKEKSEIKVYEDEQELKETLLTGDLNTTGSSLYVAKDTQDIFLSDQKLKELQTKQALAYVHKHIVGFDNPQKISLKNISGDYELIKTDDQWHLTAPIKILADTLFVEGMLNHLKNFEIDEVLEKNDFSDLIKQNLLVKPDFFFEITDNSQAKKTLYIGESVPKGGPNTPYHAFIYRDRLPFVFKKSPIKPGHFYYTLSDLGVKKVFSIKSSDVQSFKVTKDNKTKNFVQKDNQWIEEQSNTDSELNEFIPSHALLALKANKFLKQNKNEKLTVDYMISVIDNHGQEQKLFVYKEPYKQNNLNFIQVYSSAHNIQLLFDNKQIDIISDAVDKVMNVNKKESEK